MCNCTCVSECERCKAQAQGRHDVDWQSVQSRADSADNSMLRWRRPKPPSRQRQANATQPGSPGFLSEQFEERDMPGAWKAPCGARRLSALERRQLAQDDWRKTTLAGHNSRSATDPCVNAYFLLPSLCAARSSSAISEPSPDASALYTAAPSSTPNACAGSVPWRPGSFSCFFAFSCFGLGRTLAAGAAKLGKFMPGIAYETGAAGMAGAAIFAARV